MPAVSAAAFDRQLRSLSEAELSAFVADLWAARGFETAVEDGTVAIERPSNGLQERIAVGRAHDSEEADILIDLSGGHASQAEADVRVLHADDLRGMLLYAIDRDTAGRLYAGHFGRSLDAEPSVPLRRRLHRRLTRRVLGAVLIAFLVAGAALGTPGGAPMVGSSDQFVPAVPVPVDGPHTKQPTATSTTPAVMTDRYRPAGGGDLFRYPPGIGPTGVTDAQALAAAHRSSVASTAWKLRLHHNRSIDLIHPFRDWSAAEQTVVRASPSRYRFEVVGLERIQSGSIASTTYVDYGDGAANYRRLIGLHGEAYKRTQLPSEDEPGVFAAVSAAYVRRYLSTTETRIEPVRVGNTTRTRVVAEGRPVAFARTVANYTAVAIVDRQGTVHRLTVQYTLLQRVPDPTPNGVATPYASPVDVPTEPVAAVRFEMSLTEFGAANLTAPSWYDTARTATNATDLPPWPNDPAT